MTAELRPVLEARRTMRSTARPLALGAAGCALVYVLVAHVLPLLPTSGTAGHWETPLPLVVLGMIVGTTYGLLAVGLILIYRTNRIINFAHGEIGAFGAAVFGIAVVRWHIPYYLALPIGFAAAGGVAALAEVGVVRRLRHAPRLMSIVATLGVGQFLLLFSGAINSQAGSGTLYPKPPWLPEFFLGALRVTRPYVGMLVFGPIVVVALALFLRRSRFGLGIRCSASNPEAARMAGIFSARMSSLAWALAGMLSTFTAILVLPARGFGAGDSFGPGLLLRALAAAVLTRMNNLPAALFAGVGLGVMEQLLLTNYPRGSFVELVLFVLILGSLLFVKGNVGRDEEKGSWTAIRAWRPLPEAVSRLRSVQGLRLGLALSVLAMALLLPTMSSPSTMVILAGMICFAIVGLSVGIITGLAGQLSLGQFALAGVGAVVSYHVSTRTGNIVLALVYAGLAAALASLVIGLPALRIRGLMLTVATLGLAQVTPGWFLQQPWAFGAGATLERPTLAGIDFEPSKSYYFFALGVLVLMYLLARNVRRGGFGRLLIAVRDNEDNARAFTVRARAVKLQGFLVAGFVAGIGGAVYGHLLSRVNAGIFSTALNIDVVTMSVIGGISMLAGPIIGVLYTVGLPAFVPLDNAGFATAAAGTLLLILYLPGGLAQPLMAIRDRIIAVVARRQGVELDWSSTTTVGRDEDAVAASRARLSALPRRVEDDRARAPGSVLLEAVHLSKRFGGVTAVADVSFSVHEGETVGLIGPNGAGKTTTFELLGGFTRQDTGRIVFDGEDVGDISAEDRGGMGLIRSFQDAALFPTMTVLDCISLALERTVPTPFFRSLLGLPRSEKEKARIAHALVGTMGLDRYRHKQVQELSTGTRRIVELACLVALQPRMLLLDEPSSGIAQRETEALGNLLQDLKRELDLTLLVIEHDIPMIMSLSDRIVAMDAGKVIAIGDPETVRHDPRVVEAYLGGSLEAIERSSARANGANGKHAGPMGELVIPDIPGLGDARRRVLLDAFGSVEGVKAASLDDLVALPGFGPRLAERVLDRLR